jgi:hypothetical protein
MIPSGILRAQAPVAIFEVPKDPKIDRRVLAIINSNLVLRTELPANPIKPAVAAEFIEKLAAKAIKAPASPLRPKSPETL